MEKVYLKEDQEIIDVDGIKWITEGKEFIILNEEKFISLTFYSSEKGIEITDEKRNSIIIPEWEWLDYDVELRFHLNPQERKEILKSGKKIFVKNALEDWAWKEALQNKEWRIR